MEKNAQKKTRVLFFAWGDSIHARRRIRIFAEDPSFEVGVISTFKYDFENVENFYLCDTGGVKQILSKMSFFRKMLRGPLLGLLYILMRCRDSETTLYDCYKLIADAQLIKDYTKKFKPDVIFLQTLLYPCYLAYLLPTKIPLMITFWNGDVTWWAKWNGVERAFKRQLVQYGVRRAEAISVNSQMAYTACLTYTKEKEKVYLVRYPGVDLKIFTPIEKKVARRHIGINENKYVVFCPRGASIYLNNDIIVESAKYVIDELHDVLFHFISITSAEEEVGSLKKRAVELGIADKFRWDGKVPWNEMPNYYSAADVTVSMSSNDSLPNCMLESMSCGTPIVMGDIPQIREWITDGENGYLVPTREPRALAEKIISVLVDENNIIKTFIEKNKRLVYEEANMEVNINTIKKLTKETSNLHITV